MDKDRVKLNDYDKRGRGAESKFAVGAKKTVTTLCPPPIIEGECVPKRLDERVSEHSPTYLHFVDASFVKEIPATGIFGCL